MKRTNKIKIIEYLKDKAWVNKAIIERDLTEEGGYASTIDRTLRMLRKDGILAVRRKGRGSEYCLISEHTRNFHKVINMQNVRIRKEKKQEDDKPLTLGL